MRSLFEQAVEIAAGHVLVAVERGVDAFPEGLLYALPASLTDLRDGERVTVPLGPGNRPTAGYVIRRASAEEAAALDPRKVKRVVARDGDTPPLPGELVQLARWISGYYCCPIGITVSSLLPAAVRRAVGTVTRTFIDLGGPSELVGKLPTKQRELLAFVAGLALSELPIESRELLARASIATPAPLKSLVAKGLLRAERRTEVEAKFERAGLAEGCAPALTTTQRSIVDSIAARFADGFSQHLLYGVTGSGKTEVYIQLIERTLARGRCAIVLVPEIALTPQTGGRLVSRFPARRVAILHSGLTAAQRNHMWTIVAKGEADIVIGARSAIFAPVRDGKLGLVIVDEEHDSSYKSDQAPRYQGRDVALRRGQIAGCPVVLGSATPSLESWFNATRTTATGSSICTLHRMPERAPGLSVPKVYVVNFAEERRRYRDRRVHLIGPTLKDALDAALKAGGQAVILLNRRGYANYVSCAAGDCDWVMRCDHCDAGMVCHRARFDTQDGTVGKRDYTRCHHCDSELRLPKDCPQCGKRVNVFGLGTQRVEEELERLFPQLVEGKTMLRVDADAMHDEMDFRDALERFASGDVRVLLGTQMIAKGLDFPNVRVVGVISADTALHMPDFRAAERTFQLVSQVSGRCGRGEHAGVAIVQTFQPNTPSIVLAAKHDYERFAELELADRAKFALPPSRRLARLVVRDAGETRSAERAEALAQALRGMCGVGLFTAIEVRGASPCPITRIANRYRHQVEVFAPNAAELSRFLTRARNDGLFSGRLSLGEDLAIDVDPVSLM